MSQYAFDRISNDDFEQTLAQYPETVPSKLSDLEEQRLSTIPAKLKERKAKGNAYLTKSEVATLVDWKLSHGKFRPSLKGLVQQNSEEFVEATTSEGFSAASWPESLNTLVKLKGIGPATAALLLSTNNPEELPFFSDELFRWAFWADVPGSRWDRKIKYSLKEYRDLVARVDELRDRIGKSALEAEKVAYVLGKKETSLGKSVPRDEDETTATESVDGEPPKRSGTKGNAKKTPAPTKRKVAESEPEIEKEHANQPTKKKKKSPVPSTSSRVTRSSKSTQAKNS